jgi:hypothetical protein
MTLHAPAQHAGTSEHHWLRDILIIGVVVVLTIGAVWALSSVRPFSTTAAPTEAQQLVDFRAGERADWAAGVMTEQLSVSNYRAAERDAWGASSTSEEQSLIDFRAGERDLR